MKLLTRRHALGLLGASTAALAAPRVLFAADAPLKLRGVFIILHTPFTKDGAVDWDDLNRLVDFVDRAGVQGVVWPQGSSSVATLTKEERLKGMEVLAKAVRGRRVQLVLGVQGKDTAEMLEFTRVAETLAPAAVIAMPPTTGKSLDDYRAYFRTLAGATKRPVIIQTSGGNREITPTTDLIIELAREFPHLGYVKEESDPVVPRMKAEIAARPAMTAVFGANFGVGWLYEMRLGLDGVITGNGMYADVFAKIWEWHEKGKHDEVRDLFAKFLLMRNLNEQIPGVDLYMLKKRGIFKTAVRRTTVPAPGAAPKMTEFVPTALEAAEIDYRFAALKPHLIQ